MPRLDIALIQTELFWEAPAQNRDLFDGLLEGVTEADLIVLPEMFTTGFSMSSERLAESMDGPTVAWMRDKASEKSATVCGSFICEDNGRYFNRLVWMPPGGTPAIYDKRHLFRMSTENEHYSAGDKRILVEIKGFKVCPLVCYDLRFPVWSRNDEGFDLLLYVANWPAPRRLHWRTLLRARAIENLCYVAGLNRIGNDGNGIGYAGDSGLIDFNGETIADLGGGPKVVSESIDLDALGAYRDAFPAWRDRDDFNLSGRFTDQV